MDELAEILKLAGVSKPLLSEYKLEGSNISITGTEKRELERKHDIRPGTQEWFRLWFSRPYMTGETPIDENFADGKNPGRKGQAKRSGVDCSKSETELRKIAANSTGERQRMAHWCANMKGGKK